MLEDMEQNRAPKQKRPYEGEPDGNSLIIPMASSSQKILRV